ncbi:hypothetical protein AMATHDRAFT_5836 [Amanita thiersii Skay4041]|uniref:DNA (cytosine-5-)-methyltransferase n=1 Tax=Amanita thiersii Skay4041 TaxID=703135 RepID=A0A2A9NJD9_9AGAR|nr:hypothetical protein AMATHDRAFT_5836 [Amanita thiersii Skay4041]
MTRRRPTAFDVSFPEDAQLESTSRLSTTTSEIGSMSHARKRNRTGDEAPEGRAPKQRQLPPVAYYSSRENETRESAEPIPGEDPEGDPCEDGEKPIRFLTDFSIFDPKHRNEMISLAALEEDDGVDRHFEGAGWVAPQFVIEDVAQEDWQDTEPVYLRLGAILRFSLDYKLSKDPIYIETEYAWYILKTPSKAYAATYKAFYTPRRISQLIISAALQRPNYTHEAFLAHYKEMVDIFGRTCQEEDYWDAAPELQTIVQGLEEYNRLKTVPIIKRLLREASSQPSRIRKLRPSLSKPRNRLPHNNLAFSGNLDLAVLSPENQNVTCVTPHIAALAEGLVQEELIVVGPRPPMWDKAEVEYQERKALAHLRSLIKRAKSMHRRNIDWRKQDRVAPRSDYVTTMKIDGEYYHIGDYIIVPIGRDGRKQAPDLPDDESAIPSTAKLPDYFWFAKIMFFNPGNNEVHVQWLEHGSQIFLQELAHPQELFLNELCDTIDINTITSKVVVRQQTDVPAEKTDFFYKFVFMKETGAFISIDRKRYSMVEQQQPPENCPVCMLHGHREQENNLAMLRGVNGQLNGFAYKGVKYHHYDFVLCKVAEGPADIGQIRKMFLDDDENDTMVTIKRVGRICSLEDILPGDTLRDERHVYMTDEEVTITIQDIIRTICVLPYQSIFDLDKWLAMSPDHFYTRFSFPSLRVSSWEDRKQIDYDQLELCGECSEAQSKWDDAMKRFLLTKRSRPMSVLDVFGGIGSFSSGLKAGFPGFNVTHAIEISPSAAKSFKANSPNTIVYNQCANIMLRYMVKTFSGHQTDVPKQLYDGKTAVPEPPKPENIDVVVAGFPCQSHSALNMFKSANDPKANLILNALSYIDHFRPSLCFFENVPGFLRYALNTTQVSIHRVEGGIPMGGLKIVIRALVDMGYQVQFCLLHAGHYGVPQRRVRFFIVAALHGYPLPKFPRPSHDFPTSETLQIKLTQGNPVQPFQGFIGTAPHPFVSIDNAIGDLPLFDWKHPHPHTLSDEKRREMRVRERTITAVECDQQASHWGPLEMAYRHAPRTSFQAAMRKKETRSLQHYTKTMKIAKVERVVTIPLKPNADYRSLPAHLLEWQASNASSSAARANYKQGLYGRLDGKSYFPTTVTNMGPTAKQCRVLHPHCLRMVTVRELARSQGIPDHFIFKALGDSVVTMHRQIGNAVPYPLAAALGRSLRDALFEKWIEDQENAIRIEDD